jgi:predicted deacylase
MGRWLMSAAVLMGTLLGLYREVTVCSAVSCMVISRRFFTSVSAGPLVFFTARQT